MRTDSSSSLGSAYNIDEAVSPTSSTTGPTELDKEVWTKLRSYGKFFTVKLLQILIQSRSNDKHDQPCKGEKSPSIWFNLNTEEIGEVTAQVKRSLPKYPPETEAVSVDFYLYTADSDTLPLESWTFHIDRGMIARAEGKTEMSELYHQLSTLLKSSMIASRMTPMHRYYVKKQSAETFVILYKIQPGTTSVDLGSDMQTKVLGCFPTPVGTYTLTLRYRTRMEIEQKLAQSTIGLSPDTAGDNMDSFQKVGSFSSGNTPDYDQIATSPQSIDAISHFSVSPSSTNSPSNPSFLRGIAQNRSTRSRTCSLASEPEESHSPSPKDKMNASQSMPAIQKNMPFANLLTLSYTGTLGVLKSVPEEKEKQAEGETEKSEEEEQEEKPEAKRAKSEPRSDEAAVDLEHSQQTVVDDCMNDTIKPPASDEKMDSEDEEDSFVKIPAYGAVDNDDNQGLSELISTCRAPAKIGSFGDDDITNVLTQLDSFSSNQGTFDQFLSYVREMAEHDADS